MRVLQLDTGRQMRGGQFQALLLLRGLESEGLAAPLLAPRGSPLAAEAARQGGRVEPLTPGRLLANLRRVDLVHAHDARSHTLAALLPGPPLVVSRRVAFPVGTGWASRWKYARAAHYIAVSRYVAERLAEAGVPAAKVSVVYDGVQAPRAAAARSAGGAVVALDTADPMKGGALAREAAALAGVDVRFSNDLSRDLPEAAAFLYLTHAEGFGSAALLAMAHGVPVIASRVGGLAEVIEDGRTGLLVANSAAEAAAALRRLLEDRDLAGRLGCAGRERAASLFTAENMVRQTIAVYRKVLGC